MANEILSKGIKSTIEIKYRGPLSKYKLLHLHQYLNKHGKQILKEKERTFYFESTAFPSIGDFSWGAARMSIKSYKKYIQLRLKEGNAAAHRREELTVNISKSQAINFLYMLHRLGLKDVFYRPAFRQEYRYGNLIIIIKQQCVMGDHFEILFKDESTKTIEELNNFCRKLELKCWTESQYKNRITKLMKTSPAISILEAPIM